MRKILFFFWVAALLVVVTAPFAAADLFQDLTANISCSSCSSSFFPGTPSDPPHYQIAPGYGSASFAALGLPWGIFLSPRGFRSVGTMKESFTG